MTVISTKMSYLYVLDHPGFLNPHNVIAWRTKMGDQKSFFKKIEKQSAYELFNCSPWSANRPGYCIERFIDYMLVINGFQKRNIYFIIIPF